jgi:predicted secreted protein
MALVNGTDLVLYVLDGVNNRAFGHSRSFTLNVEANTIDVTSRDSAGWSEFLIGARSFTMDFEGLVDYSDNIDPAWLQTAMSNQTKFLAKFTAANPATPGALIYNGYVYVSSLTIDGPMEDVVTYSGTLQGTEIFLETIA